MRKPCWCPLIGLNCAVCIKVSVIVINHVMNPIKKLEPLQGMAGKVDTVPGVQLVMSIQCPCAPQVCLGCPQSVC
jgi:hypothetical protein